MPYNLTPLQDARRFARVLKACKRLAEHTDPNNKLFHRSKVWAERSCLYATNSIAIVCVNETVGSCELLVPDGKLIIETAHAYDRVPIIESIDEIFIKRSRAKLRYINPYYANQVIDVFKAAELKMYIEDWDDRVYFCGRDETITIYAVVMKLR